MNIDEILKKVLKENIEVKIDQLIEDELKQFKKQLLLRKDNYISEVMKGIRIIHEREPGALCMNYKIMFENINILKKENEV